MYVCACVCVYIYIYIYIYTHTHVCICVHNIVIDCEKPPTGESSIKYCILSVGTFDVHVYKP